MDKEDITWGQEHGSHASDFQRMSDEVGLQDMDSTYHPDMIPGVQTGQDVVAFYGKYGQDSSVKFFYCVRWANSLACCNRAVHVVL